ncbi:hypothetical protein GC101_15865 [Paenibacillus sp. LMG 31459]|uniref:Uncharacterized protein n=1 Tax=Paenibacillus phytohabitans TaxID=2654978 RepID=A0ABX1YHC1_9BACL|nr:hypothetical protein [Paenibacillus phytohabitans]NOU80347.1 hypothetical protein [Paenibacillus phytohabitans]
MSINSNIDIVQRKIAPCTGPLVCSTFIGKGDYEIEAVVDLYSLEGSVVDLAKVQFRIGTSYMVIEGTSNNRVLLNDISREQSTCFVSGSQGFLQKFHVCISYVPAVGGQNGQIYVHGLLTDRFGHSPKSISYLIAEWHGLQNECNWHACSSSVLSSEGSGPLTMSIDLFKDYPCIIYNAASVSFIDKASGIGLVQDYKLGWRQQDPLFLFNQNLEERHILLYPAGGPYSDSLVKEVRVNRIWLTIPRADLEGSLCIEGFYLTQNKWHCIQPQVLAKWTVNDQ